MNWISTALATIRQYLLQLLAGQKDLRKELDDVQRDVALILKYVSPAPAAALVLTITNAQGEQQMTAAKQAKGFMKLDMQDNGHLKATLTVLDDAGLPTTWDGAAVPSWATSNPALVVTPAADGLSADLGPSTPPQLATGIIVTATGTNGRGAALSVDNSSDPINIVPGPAGSLVLQVGAA